MFFKKKIFYIYLFAFCNTGIFFFVSFKEVCADDISQKNNTKSITRYDKIISNIKSKDISPLQQKNYDNYNNINKQNNLNCILLDNEVENFFNTALSSILRSYQMLYTVDLKIFLIQNDEIGIFNIENKYLLVTTGLINLSKNSDIFMTLLAKEVSTIKNTMFNNIKQNDYSINEILSNSALLINSNLSLHPIAKEKANNINLKQSTYQTSDNSVEKIVTLFESQMRNMDDYIDFLSYLHNTKELPTELLKYKAHNPMNIDDFNKINRAAFFTRDKYNKFRNHDLEDKFLKIRSKIKYFLKPQNLNLINASFGEIDTNFKEKESWYDKYPITFNENLHDIETVRDLINNKSKYDYNFFIQELLIYMKLNMQKEINLFDFEADLSFFSTDQKDIMYLQLLNIIIINNLSNDLEIANYIEDYLKNKRNQDFNPIFLNLLASFYKKKQNLIMENFYLSKYFLSILNYNQAMEHVKKAILLNETQQNKDYQIANDLNTLINELRHRI